MAISKIQRGKDYGATSLLCITPAILGSPHLLDMLLFGFVNVALRCPPRACLLSCCHSNKAKPTPPAPDCRKCSLCADYRDCRLGVGALFAEVIWRSKFWKTQQSARHANTPPFFRAGGAPHLVLVRICIMAFPDPCKPLRADWCYGFPILCSIAPSETSTVWGFLLCTICLRTQKS